VTIADKLIIQQKLRETDAACVASARTCADFKEVLAEVKAWSDWDQYNIKPSTDAAIYQTATLASAYSIIFSESGEWCADDFGAGSFVGDVNKNGYLDCDDALEIQNYVAGFPPLLSFDVALADTDGTGVISGRDSLVAQLALIILENNYTNYVGGCHSLP
jgi:hypothetical protein